MPMKQADVIIAGGGMVGLTLGLALAQGGLKTVLVDALAPATTLDARFDGRVSALAYASVWMLTALGVWRHLEADAQPISQILVTDGKPGRRASPFSLHFDAAEVGAPALGHIAENRHIRRALHAAASANMELIAPASVTRLEISLGGVLAQLSDGETIKAQLAVAADG